MSTFTEKTHCGAMFMIWDQGNTSKESKNSGSVIFITSLLPLTISTNVEDCGGTERNLLNKSAADMPGW